METIPLELEQVTLNHFRNLKSLTIDLKSKIIFFTGENGIGKTSILESISMMSLLKSFRTNSQKDMLAWNESFYTIDLIYSVNGEAQKAHLGYSPAVKEKQRSLILNEKKLTRVSEFIGKFHSIVFSPDDLSIIDTSMTERRSFVDMILSSLHTSYLKDLQTYKRLLQIKSIMLRKSSLNHYDKTFFTSIHKQLAQCGHRIQESRLNFFNSFQKPFQKYIALISGNCDHWELNYLPSIANGETFEGFFEALENALPKDFRYKYSTSGIHRDKIRILLISPQNKPDNVLDMKQTASQGQKRTIALALKMAQFDYTKQETMKVPVLLIDDVLNELDTKRRSRFIEFLSDIGQALITSTDVLGLEKFIEFKQQKTSVSIYQIQHGPDGVELNKV